MDGPVKYYTKDQAKLLFKILKQKGIIVSLGRGTGNFWSAGYKKKLAWLMKDSIGGWAVETLLEETDKR